MAMAPQVDMMTITLAAATALLVFAAAAVTPSSSAAVVPPPVPVNDECNKDCAKFEKTDPAKFDQCKDECIVAEGFKVAAQGLDECNKDCESKGGSTAQVGICMEACTAKVDAIVTSIAKEACHRDCARDSKDAAARSKCDALCGKGAGAATAEEAAPKQPQ